MFKNTRFLFLMVMIICTFSVGKDAVFAASISGYEQESNDVQSDATTIQVNKVYVGNSAHGEDADWYKFVVPEDSKGYFQVRLKPDVNADLDALGNGWEYGIYKADDGAELWFEDNIYCEWLTTPFPFDSGVYYVKVAPSFVFSWTNQTYNLSVEYITSDNWETEYNDSMASADVMKLNTTYYGNDMFVSDVDWYKVTLPKAGKINYIFGPDSNTDVTNIGDGWQLRVYREDMSDAISGADRVKGKVVSSNLYWDAGTYYFQVMDDWAVDGTRKNVYNLRVNYTVGGNYESEFNNSMTTADKVSTGVEYTGNLYYDWPGPDCDYYVFTPRYTGTITMDFSRVITNAVGNGFNIRVIDRDNEVLSELKYVKNATASIKNVSVKKGRKYYILIQNQTTFSPIEAVDYCFKITESKAFNKSTVSGLTAKSKSKKKVTLRWKKLNGACGYKLYRSTKKKSGYTCIKTIKKGKTITFTDRKVKSKKIYYYKVRAYTKSGDKRTYSKYSTVKKVKVK